MTTLEAAMTRHEAERITERINIALNRVSDAWADLAERISEAYRRRADLALGYGSWQEYAAAELRPAEGIAADIRRQLVGMLAAQGMSVRSIAPAVGAPRETVRRDSHVAQSGSPADEAEVIDYETGEVLDHDRTPTLIDPAPAPKVTGLDGKTYTRPTPKPEPAASKRRSLPDQFFDAAYDLNRRVESVRRLTEDDRLDANKEKIAQKHLSDLIQSRDLLQQVIDRLS